MNLKPTCSCGSGLYPHELCDARGIYVGKVCGECEEEVRSKYRAEIFVNAGYECDEQIEDDY